jgi:hypothetical protein
MGMEWGRGKVNGALEGITGKNWSLGKVRTVRKVRIFIVRSALVIAPELSERNRATGRGRRGRSEKDRRGKGRRDEGKQGEEGG